MKNLFFPGFNKTIDFKNLKSEDIKSATDLVIENTKKSLQHIYSIDARHRSFKNTMEAYDDLSDELSSVFSNIYLMGFVNDNSLIRDESQKSIAVLSKYSNELQLDENLYNAIRDYSLTPEAKELTGYKKKFLKETLERFKRNGFALDREKRAELKVIQDKLSDIELKFSANIAAYNDSLLVDEKGIEGLPEDYKTARKTKDGHYKIDLTYPSYFPFMKYAKSDDARKQLYIKFQNRAAPANLQVLDSMLDERAQMATLLGYPTFAAYQVEDRMVKNTKRVWDFENNLIQNVKLKADKDYALLIEEKRNYTKDPSADKIEPWEASFYTNLLLLNKYQLDNEKLKEYFEMNEVINGVMSIAKQLYDIDFKEIEHPSVWNPEVKMFEVHQSSKLIGYLYLDLFPRPNKYGHAACFPMISGHLTAKGYQLPVASLVCNFPRPTADKPSLIPHSDVETFFHEFGHLMHHILTRAELSSQAGTSVANDFVEVPSQFFENWAWNYESLKLFAKHYKTGEMLPKDLFNKMLAAKNVNSGIGTLQQIFYGTLDFTLHDRFDARGKETTTDVVRKLQNQITLYPYLEGTYFQASFDHLNGYGAGYYGYLWAKVYAEDMFSLFGDKNILNKQLGNRFRDKVLAKGSTMDELDIVKEFLGREPSNEAFLKSLGL
ncbi:MAG: M3 family metallopeptidase [Bacteroidota bacterium]|nr:M3 family metallopeptidase [Bacteroidota bacterium]